MARRDTRAGKPTSAKKQELAQREAELAILNSVQMGLASRLEAQAIYDLVGDGVRDIFDAQVVMISTYDAQTETMEHRYAIERGERVYAPGQFPVRGFRTQIARTRRPVLANSNVAKRAARLGQPTLPGTITPKSWLGVPMIVRDRVTGFLSLQDVEKENAFDKADVRLLETLAASLGVALENARLWEQEELYRKSLERELEIGRTVQQGFLPDDLPQPRGWEVAASLRPAREVAGDFYDVFELGSGQLGLVIGDVCDKGIGAALFMSLFRTLIRVVAKADDPSIPAGAAAAGERLRRTVALINTYILENHPAAAMFASLFFALLDTGSGTLTYLNAGHWAPLLLGPDGIRASLQRTGPVVGLWQNAEYTTAEAAIEEGESLFAFTDGLTDASNAAGEFFGKQGKMPVLVVDRSLESSLDELSRDLEDFCHGAEQMDDVTMLAVRRLPR